VTRRPRRPKARPARETANTYGLPTGAAIRRLLRQWFRAQRLTVLEAIGAPKRGVKDLGDLPPLPDLNGDPREMAPAFVPMLRAIWSRSGRRARLDLGLDPDTFTVIDPNVERSIEAAALAFCEATNATTTDALETALAETRRELIEGVVERGEALRKLTARVNRVFDQAERWRARRIAQSEASRAHHAAQLRSAKDSGVVAGTEILVSSDACPLCQTIARRHQFTRLNEPIAVVGDNPTYSVIEHPPFHPHCNCTLLYVLKSEYSGEPQPDWSNGPLEQPEPEPVDYGLAGEAVPGPDLAIEPEPEPPPKPRHGRRNLPVTDFIRRGLAVPRIDRDAIEAMEPTLDPSQAIPVRLDTLHGQGDQFGLLQDAVNQRISEYYRDHYSVLHHRPPVVIRDTDGTLYVHEGHHRITGAIMRGDRELRAFVVEPESLDSIAPRLVTEPILPGIPRPEPDRRD
jgi:hypothetical protein